MSSRYLTTARMAGVMACLSERDRAVIGTLSELPVASAAQLRRLHFADVSSRQCRQVLASLVARRLIARQDRVIGGVRSGSSGYIFRLDLAGQRLLSPGRRPTRPWQGGVSFLAHNLAVTDVLVALTEAQAAGSLLVVSFLGEPHCWRRFSGPGGGGVTLKPDAALTIRLGGFEDHWFLEVDRGTEARATLLRKCETYRRYWQTGVEQTRVGVFPRVLWVVPDAARHDVLVDVLGWLPVEAWPLFVVTTEAEVTQRLVQGAAS